MKLKQKGAGTLKGASWANFFLAALYVTLCCICLSSFQCFILHLLTIQVILKCSQTKWIWEDFVRAKHLSVPSVWMTSNKERNLNSQKTALDLLKYTERQFIISQTAHSRITWQHHSLKSCYSCWTKQLILTQLSIFCDWHNFLSLNTFLLK